MVLELARPSEPWCFPAGRWFCRSCLNASSRRQQNLSKISKQVVFLGFQTGRLAVFRRGFGTSSSFRAMVFSCWKVILSKLFECKQPQATESLENLEKGCFSRISDGTFGSFSAWFWN